MQTRSRLAALLAVLLLTLTACGKSNGTAPAASPTAANGPELSGQLLETGETSLDLVDRGRRSAIMRSQSATMYFEYPTFAPDAKRIAYVLATTPTGQGQDWGNDIYTANLDGSDARPAFKHDKPGALVDALSWTPDGAAIVFAYSRTLYDAQGHYTGSIYQVERLTLADGSRTVLLKNAIQPSLSADGKQIVYVDFPQNEFQQPSLAIANSDGSNPRRLLTQHKGFQAFFAPHLSPDGMHVAFAAVGGPLSLPGVSPTPGAQRVPGPRPPDSATPRALRAWLRPAIAEADGASWQIWTADLDGTQLRTVTGLREDLPFPIWSADGKTILFLGSAGLYTASADGTNLKKIGPGIPHGEIAWNQK